MLLSFTIQYSIAVQYTGCIGCSYYVPDREAIAIYSDNDLNRWFSKFLDAFVPLLILEHFIPPLLILLKS